MLLLIHSPLVLSPWTIKYIGHFLWYQVYLKFRILLNHIQYFLICSHSSASSWNIHKTVNLGVSSNRVTSNSFPFNLRYLEYKVGHFLWYQAYLKSRVLLNHIQYFLICSHSSASGWIIHKTTILPTVSLGNHSKNTFFPVFTPYLTKNLTWAILQSWFLWKNWSLDQISLEYLKNCRMPSFEGFKYFRFPIPFFSGECDTLFYEFVIFLDFLTFHTILVKSNQTHFDYFGILFTKLIVLETQKSFWNSRVKAENLKFFFDH